MNNKFNKIKDSISKETLINLYITENKTKNELCEYFNISLHQISKLLQFYNISKTQEQISQKRKTTNIAKYGVDNPSKNNMIIKKITDHMIAKYGTSCYLTSNEGHQKVLNTKLYRYGDENYNNCEKAKLTKKVKYNNENYNNRKKYIQTMNEKYDVDNTFQLPHIKSSNIETLISNKKYSEQFKKIYLNRDKAIEFLKNKEYNYFDLSKIFNAPVYTVQQWVYRLNLQEYINYKFIGKSHYEDDIYNYLISLNINNIQRNVKILDGLEIDIYLPDYNLGIEFNGTYWHSDLFKDKNYHYIKSLTAVQNNIHLIHIYQYEWDDIEKQQLIKSIICEKLHININKIYARKCDILKVTNKEAEVFNNINHLQKHRTARITYGLYYKNELVQLMSFSHNQKYQWEIIRSCSKMNTLIIGGTSKLFNYFIEQNNPDSVFSYCDFNKFNGNSYEKCNMKFIGYTGSDMKYILKGNVINRCPNRYKELKSKIDARIYGSGSKKYLWVK